MKDFTFAAILGLLLSGTVIGWVISEGRTRVAADDLCRLYGFQSGTFDRMQGFVCYQVPTPLWPVQTERAQQ